MNQQIDSFTEPVGLSRWSSLSALFALFIFSLRRLIHGRRLLVLSLVFLLPSLLVLLVFLTTQLKGPFNQVHFAMIFTLIPHALAPLAALLYASGIVQDDIEEQTLTYLLVRPLPRWTIYVVKLLASLLMTIVLITVFTGITYLTISLTCILPENTDIVVMAAKAVALLALAQIGYSAVFGFLGLLLRRTFVVGVAYIFIFEGIMASLDMLFRQLTIMYYFRVLAMRWIQPQWGGTWSIDLKNAPSMQTCVWVLLGVGLFLSILGAFIFAHREFRMKTPESS